MPTSNQDHTVHRFDSELNNIAGLVDRMGELVLDQLDRGLGTLHRADVAEAHEVISRDQLINDLDVEVDEQIFRLIARRQPVARDLREVLALGKVVAELERSGDEARKLATLTLRFYEAEGHPPSEQIVRDIYTMAAFARNMMDISLQAFLCMDVGRAIEVLKLGEEKENEYRSTLRRLSTFILEDARNVGHFVDIVLGIRALDRFGSHALNIAGHVIFFARGVDVRHLGLDDILHRIAE